MTDVAARKAMTAPRLGQEAVKRALDITVSSALFFSLVPCCCSCGAWCG